VKILLIGHGRMGRLVQSLAGSYGCEVAGIVTSRSPVDAIEALPAGAAACAIDFSAADAVAATVERLAARHINVVIGTTGWQARQAELRATVERAGIGVLAASNFAVGMQIFRAAVETAAARFAAAPEVGAWIHEAHHAAKKDAPSGTALTLEAAMQRAGYRRRIDISSTRAGSIPGTHTVGFDSASETVTLTHEVRDRAVFARGALQAATWLAGRQGWFGIEDMIERA
jgi:4-hydroxy-tetrahydrodipicolinate reductase